MKTYLLILFFPITLFAQNDTLALKDYFVFNKNLLINDSIKPFVTVNRSENYEENKKNILIPQNKTIYNYSGSLPLVDYSTGFGARENLEEDVIVKIGENLLQFSKWYGIGYEFNVFLYPMDKGNVPKTYASRKLLVATSDSDYSHIITIKKIEIISEDTILFFYEEDGSFLRKKIITIEENELGVYLLSFIGENYKF
ncbi:MAG: hypothetical protein R2798_08070 [Chitinophagales bacterium]|nr:hypothetical protein [Bacteroidota bacterium]MCB9042390.1 hypothetical protein [Chitinophagales bacterium]